MRQKAFALPAKAAEAMTSELSMIAKSIKLDE